MRGLRGHSRNNNPVGVCEAGVSALAISAILDRRLDAKLTQPIAVAFSGGGDSLGALIATKAWAERCGRPVIALHVDHRLQASSAAWREVAAEAAQRLGVEFHGLAWVGEKPAHGVAAAARRARHGLIAEAAREAGATTVVFGHTADDIAESALMRAEGSSLGPPREWRPSPVWPEGRGVFILRPLLAVRRAAIRGALRALGWHWIDDPANEDPRQPRARARRQLAVAMVGPTPIADDLDPTLSAIPARFDDWGTIRFDRARLRRAPKADGRRMLAAAMLCVGGGERPPRAERVGALFDRLAGLEDFTATLAGARLVASVDILIARNGGEIARGGLAPVALEPGRATVWDGRFELRTDRPGLGVIALKGAQARLDAETRRRLKAAPAAARPALPLVDAGGAMACPILAGDHGIDVHSLVGARFLAACGAVSKEPRA